MSLLYNTHNSFDVLLLANIYQSRRNLVGSEIKQFRIRETFILGQDTNTTNKSHFIFISLLYYTHTSLWGVSSSQ